MIVPPMKMHLLLLTVALIGGAASPGADQTWTGKIADSACGAKHEEAAENQGVMPDRECTEACVRGGSKYILIVDGKVLKIANQDNKDLAVHAGHAVKVTGELKGSEITVSKIEMQK
jgi:hypothetical protein